MAYLIDTHTFIWFIEGSSELKLEAKEIISNNTNKIYLSIVSLWEIAIKLSIGKLTIIGGFEKVIEDAELSEIDILGINFKDLLLMNKLKYFHKDPFDRMIIAQALSNSFDIISKDSNFDKYLINSNIERIWN